MTLLNSTFDRPVVVPVDAGGNPLGVAGNPLVISNPAVTVADGGDVAQGARADAAATNTTGAWSIVSLLKASVAALLAPTPAGTNNIGIVTPLDGTQPNGTTGYSLSAVGTFFTQDTSGYPSISVQVTAIAASSAIAFEVSNDGTTWIAKIGVASTNGGASGDQASTSGVGLYAFSLSERFFRVRQSSYGGSGASTVVATLKATQPSVRSGYLGGGIVTPAVSATATGALSTTSRLVSCAAGTNPTLVKAAAGRLYRVDAYNASASTKYLKLYAKSTAPVPGTDVPIRTVPLPAGQQNAIQWADLGLYVATGIGFALTGAPADADTTALAAGDVTCLHVDYA